MFVKSSQKYIMGSKVSRTHVIEEAETQVSSNHIEGISPHEDLPICWACVTNSTCSVSGRFCITPSAKSHGYSTDFVAAR